MKFALVIWVTFAISTLAQINHLTGNPGPSLQQELQQSIRKDEVQRLQNAQVQARLLAIQNFIPTDPWRITRTGTNFAKGDGWVQFTGRVFQTVPDGVLMRGGYGTPPYFDGYGNVEFFVANFPYQMADGEIILTSQNFTAQQAGTHTYTTVQNASHTIRKLEYGIPCSPPKELIEQQMALQAAEAERKQQRKREIDQKAFNWLFSQATNGSPSAQYSLGMHYLNGQGCETNLQEAVKWLKNAALSGSLEASNQLLTLK